MTFTVSSNATNGAGTGHESPKNYEKGHSLASKWPRLPVTQSKHVFVQSQLSQSRFDKRRSLTELQFGCFIRHVEVWLSSQESRQEISPELGDDGMPETQTRSSSLC